MKFDVKWLGKTLLACAALACAAVAPFATAVLAANPEATPQEATSQEATPRDGGISYYQDHCVRCHGNYGINYDVKQMATVPAAKLHEVIAEMTEGQGQAPLTGQDLEAQIAYHRSLMDGKPYLFVKGAYLENGGLILRGDVTPDAKMQVLSGNKIYRATIDEHNWTATLPAGIDWQSVVITATIGEQKTELKAGDGFSHQAK